MQFTPEIQHVDEDLLSKYADKFNIFRQEMTLIDLSILTKGGTVIPAHKLVLCAQFPGIKNSILNSGNSNLSNWSRFPHEYVICLNSIINLISTVLAVVDFAYTGEIVINVENVVAIYLMAHNLGCKKLINWTTDFIKTRCIELPQMPTPRYGTGAAHIPGVGEIVVGGYTEIGGNAPGVDNAEILLANSSPLGHAGTWCEIAPMLNSVANPSAEFLNGKIYVAVDFRNSNSPVEILSIFSEGPTQCTKVTNTSSGLESTICLDGSLLFGCCALNTTSSTMKRFSAVPSLPLARKKANF
nr:hypothetical protein HmN_001003300 [Hymenolepis microstoma]